MAKKEKEAKQKSSYFKDMKTELKKVVWPTPKELLNSTLAVIAFVLIFAVIVFVLDLCFDNLNKYVITPVQESVQESLTTDEEEETDSEEESDEETTDEESEEDTSTETEDEEITTEGLETEEIEVESSSDTEETE